MGLLNSQQLSNIIYIYFEVIKTANTTPKSMLYIMTAMKLKIRINMYSHRTHTYTGTVSNLINC